MPTNLPPECLEIEGRYREASSPEEKIACLEELLGAIPKHKGTDKLRADLRRRLAKLKAAAQTGKHTGRQASAFHIDKEGAGQVVLVGSANVGKSALLAALTNATPEVGDQPYTTRMPTPGMITVEGVQIQLIDTPSLNRDFVEGELVNLIRRADLILVLVDLQAYPIEQLEETIALLEENRIAPRQQESLVVEQSSMLRIPCVVGVNKNDDETTDEDFRVLCELLGDAWLLVPLSASSGRNLEQLKRVLLDQLQVIRVYAKPPGKEADLNAPFVLKKGSTIEEFAGKVHRDFQEKLKSARVWGSGAYDGQMVARDHVLQDGDVVELRV